jgi:apolipoprotein N-acyltransferase
MNPRAGARRAASALIALGAGALLPLAFAPRGWWLLALLAPAALLHVLRECNNRAALVRGWLFGLGMYGTGTSWVYVSIHDYGAAPVPLAAALTLLFCAGLAIFPGVPGLYLGDSQLEGPLHSWVPVLGTLGTGLILVFTATALFLLWERAMPAIGNRAQGALLQGTSMWERAIPAIVVVLWLGAWPLSRIEWTTPTGPVRSVAMVQGNIPQLLKWEPDHLENTLAIYADLSAPLWGADFVVWPESAVPAYLDLVTDYLSEQATLAAQSGSALLLGLPSRDGRRGEEYATYNSVAELGADSGLYHKRRLVPFGEYVPLEHLLRGLIAFFDLPMSGFARGPEEQPLLRAHGIALGTFICYEIAYPELVRGALPDAALLLTVSNDTWFGASLGPLQHLALARMRALENGRDLIRATNNGVTALVDAHGRVTVQGAQFTREVVRGSVQPRTGLTPYARLGSWPALAIGALMLLALLARRASTDVGAGNSNGPRDSRP